MHQNSWSWIVIGLLISFTLSCGSVNSIFGLRNNPEDLDGYTTLIEVEGGSFEMGSADEVPVHTVTLDDFYMSRSEVTNQQYEFITGKDILSSGSTEPFNSASWYEAIEFCNYLSLFYGFTPVYTAWGETDPDLWQEISDYQEGYWDTLVIDISTDGFRLPTEAEWEYAARGGINHSEYLYAGSDTEADVVWENPGSYSDIQEVEQMDPNILGLHDLSGNSSEWCQDWYDSGYYTSSPSDNPNGPSTGTKKVIRDGIVTSRGSDYPAGSSTGFRVVRR